MSRLKMYVLIALLVGLMGCDIESRPRRLAFEKGLIIGMAMTVCAHDDIDTFKPYLFDQFTQAATHLFTQRDAILGRALDCRQLKAIISGGADL